MPTFNSFASRTYAWARENPGKAALYGVAGVGTRVALAPAAAAAPVLTALGFTADGIAKLSIASGIQSGIGSVVAPSLFSTLQSAAMGGYGAAVVNGVVSAGGAVIAVASGGAAMKTRNRTSSYINPIEYVWVWLRNDISSETGDVSEIQDNSSTQAIEAMEQKWALITVDAINDQGIIDAMQRNMMRIVKEEGQDVKDMYEYAE
ncbi:hypothetical protein GGR53DRAFT_161510 [Hypoxylon sp. FL1150]|nr:hypothetical protein GGR53DRAFT_161510 [Hypoxylon sp. FL1150]